MILAHFGTAMLSWKLHQKFQKYGNAPIFLKL
jgi:hypothetical protein